MYPHCIRVEKGSKIHSADLVELFDVTPCVNQNTAAVFILLGFDKTLFFVQLVLIAPCSKDLNLCEPQTLLSLMGSEPIYLITCLPVTPRD